MGMAMGKRGEVRQIFRVVLHNSEPGTLQKERTIAKVTHERNRFIPLPFVFNELNIVRILLGEGRGGT
jgi:hypothetical protein